MTELRHPVVEVGRALERRADGQQGRLIEGAADQLHADRKAALGEAGRNRQRRQAEIVDRAGEARQPLDHGLAHPGLLPTSLSAIVGAGIGATGAITASTPAVAALCAASAGPRQRIASR